MYCVSPKNIDIFVEKLLNWYEKNKRDYLFWRKTKNPYHILVSEMMLQKTTVKQVQNIIEKFIEKFPTPKELAQAPIEEIEERISTLGLQHKRALNYKKLANMLLEKHDGQIPNSEKELKSLPGVGQYIANSVLYLAFEKDAPILDTNIVRILQRVFNIKTCKARPRSDKNLWEFVQKITPHKKSRDFNLSLLDYGALVCTKRNPNCPICGINSICNNYLKKVNVN